MARLADDTPNMDPIATAKRSAAVTPSDTVNFGQARSLYVGGAGTVAVVGLDNVVSTYVGCPAGFYILQQCKRVNSTGTNATNILALY